LQNSQERDEGTARTEQLRKDSQNKRPRTGNPRKDSGQQVSKDRIGLKQDDQDRPSRTAAYCRV
jgi:hypothetical protein